MKDYNTSMNNVFLFVLYNKYILTFFNGLYGLLCKNECLVFFVLYLLLLYLVYYI